MKKANFRFYTSKFWGHCIILHLRSDVAMISIIDNPITLLSSCNDLYSGIWCVIRSFKPLWVPWCTWAVSSRERLYSGFSQACKYSTLGNHSNACNSLNIRRNSGIEPLRMKNTHKFNRNQLNDECNNICWIFYSSHFVNEGAFNLFIYLFVFIYFIILSYFIYLLFSYP